MIATKAETTAHAAALKADPVNEGLMEKNPAEVTRRFLLVLRWLTETVYAGEWGSKAKAGRDLGISSALMSQLLTGKTGISLKRALESGNPWGFDEAYFTGPFVAPEKYAKPAPGVSMPVKEEQLALVRAEPEPAPVVAQDQTAKILEAALEQSQAQYPSAAPSEPEAPKKKGEFDSWLEMGREVLEREIEDVHNEWHRLQSELRDNEQRMADLQKKKAAFSDVFARLVKP
jgi:hypothetical protein